MSKINDLILKRNKAWEQANMKEKKLMLCHDVLSMLRSKKYDIRTGIYCGTGSNIGHTPEEVQSNFLKNEVQCTVCARGALMVSKFRFANDLFGHEVRNSNDRSRTFQELEEAFTESELDLIESIFEEDTEFSTYWEDTYYVDDEEDDIYLPGSTSDEHLKVLKTFSRNDGKRLKQIMERIIACDGDVIKALTCDKK